MPHRVPENSKQAARVEETSSPRFLAKALMPDDASGADGADIENNIAHIEYIKNILTRVAALPRPLVFTNGVFDVLHCGHAHYLDAARQLGASLVVAINSDASARRLNKGVERPINPLPDRMALVAALSSVDLVIAFDTDTPQSLIAKILPDVLVKGGDYTAETTAGAKDVIQAGGTFVAIPFLFDRSTTALVRKIRGAGS